jgi:transaldolase
MTSIQELAKVGQSIWIDNINRSMIESGKLKQMIAQGLLGMTSNPTIFEKAISSSSDYDQKIRDFCQAGKSSFEIYDELTVRDVQEAADLFLPVYKSTNGLDGYVSLEVNPKLAYNKDDTVKEALRLKEKVNRPNVMFKVPSTKEGLEAVEELVSCGLNVNITLIFSLEQYANTASAYMKGLRRFLEKGGDAKNLRSVASVFVSRIDNLVDKELEGSSPLKGKAAVANSSLIYKKYSDIISSLEFKDIFARGANVQRVLWGSTSTKNPAYSDVKYVTELIGKNTVNTLPDPTFKAFLDHGKARIALSSDSSSAEKIIEDLNDKQIDINQVCRKLLEDGVVAFEKSFESLLSTIESKKEALCQK